MAEQPVVELAEAEDPYCSHRCASAGRALVAVRAREEGSARLAERRQRELAGGETLAPPLSELLLQRWRAGDWAVPPETLLARLS